MTDLCQAPAKLAQCGLSLRSEEPFDQEFLVRLYESTREDELRLTGWTSEQKKTFCAFQFRAQTAHYSRIYSSADRTIVLVDAEPAGRLYLFRTPADLRIVDISLLPEFRRRGLGTALIRSVFDRADSSGMAVSLHVEIHNPARRLYERLGFEQVDDNGVYVLMRRPGTSQISGVSS